MTSPIKRPDHQAFLWVLTEPGQAVDLEAFHGTLDRRTYEIIETNGQITDMAYSPLIFTIEFPALNEENTRLRKALETHSSCKGTQTCRIIDHSLIGTSDLKSFDSDKDRLSTWVIIFEFENEIHELIPLFKIWSKTYDSFII
ncbi:hypothetical protein CROQUDRAFT_111225 [Cronartium quercuum f. sp. fusiforme G11]|uniref:Uncharacterized protein n=1 Tax=Cronartium quercuum f. sp. fusiforme G11 TaxID=708437 RepID=A0A9P6N659_9BASI|nr:hypothetical protein CROQUDRAFT_111225 [Cronartium quercuum f. sp. fusiforme G11]